MLYRIDNKFYIKVQGYYKGVDIKVNGDNLDITTNGNNIEINNTPSAEMFNMEIQKNEVIKLLNKSSSEDNTDNHDNEHSYRRRNR